MRIKYFSDSQRFKTPDVLWTAHTVCNDHRDLGGNTGKKYVSLGGCMVPCLTSCNTHVDLKVIDGMFHSGMDFVKGSPLVRIPLYTGEHTQFHVFCGIGSTPSFGTAAEVITVTDPSREKELIFEEIISFKGVKSGVVQKCMGEKSGCMEKKSERTGFKEVESPMDLSTSGESDFFPAAIYILLFVIRR